MYIVCGLNPRRAASQNLNKEDSGQATYNHPDSEQSADTDAILISSNEMYKDRQKSPLPPPLLSEYSESAFVTVQLEKDHQEGILITSV